jgi:small-conductance mechanosensitive channel
MIKSIIQITDEENTYKVGDRVRVKMHSMIPDRANEYIGNIESIHERYIVLNCGCITKNIETNKIDKLRYARDGETFDNTWNFDD